MISIENLTKSYGEHVLFDQMCFKINSGERVGLVGRNGHGKTTMLRLIVDEIHTDAGTISIPKNYRIGYVRQQLEFTKSTILEEGMTGLLEHEKDHYWKVEKILYGLGFSESDMSREPREFSGGFQVRLNMAKVLVSEPDLLLLDEPTNYLDIQSIRWIIRFLNNWSNEILLITHDRSFMDKVATHILGIHRKKVRKISGNTERYYSRILQDEEIYEKTRINDEKRTKETELFISRFRAKARLANLVQSRIKTLAKRKKQEKHEILKTLEFSFHFKPFSGKNVIKAENINFSYEQDKPIINDLDIAINAKDRVCVIGKNGKGKTTLLKLLAGDIKSRTGEIVYNPNVTKGFFEQSNLSTLVDTQTVEQEILYCHKSVDQQFARNICGAMMFSGDDSQKKISVLSGGEKSRVMLGKLLATPVNLLLLDEPTNHLDMDSCNALLAAIDCFEGTVIMVTHNEMFLHALANKLIIFKNNSQYMFHGSYQDFLEKEGWEDREKAEIFTRKEEIQQEHNLKQTKKEIRQKRSEIITEKGRILTPLKKKIKQAEELIEARESDMSGFNQAMIQASQKKDGHRISRLGKEVHKCQTDIDRLFDELETLTVDFESREDEFKKRLKDLEKL